MHRSRAKYVNLIWSRCKQAIMQYGKLQLKTRNETRIERLPSPNKTSTLLLPKNWKNKSQTLVHSELLNLKGLSKLHSSSVKGNAKGWVIGQLSHNRNAKLKRTFGLRIF